MSPSSRAEDHVGLSSHGLLRGLFFYRPSGAKKKTLIKGGWEHFGKYVVPEFKAFRNALDHFAQLAENCPGCRGGCGDPGCAIRSCAQERKLDLCSNYSDFPCDKFKTLAAKYPNLIADAQRQKQIGLDAWIKEQDQCAKTGFCYDDISYP